MGALWWEGPLTLARDSSARQQVVITEGRVSTVPPTEAHVLCPVFPAFNYLPVLHSVSPVLVVLTSLGIRSRPALATFWLGFSSGGTLPGAEAYFPTDTHPPLCLSFLSRSSFPEKSGERLNRLQGSSDALSTFQIWNANCCL